MSLETAILGGCTSPTLTSWPFLVTLAVYHEVGEEVPGTFSIAT